MCFLRGLCVCVFILFIYLFLILTVLLIATLQHHSHLSRATAPFVMWKQPFSSGDFLSFHPDAWHSWQIGCGSEGDGLWKQCFCPPLYTLCTYTRRQTDTHTRTPFIWVYTISFTFQPLSPALRQCKRLCCKQGDDLDVKTHKEKKTGNGNLDFLQL